MHISFQIRVFFFRPIPRNGIAWSYSNSILSFSRNFHFYFPQFLYQFIFPSTLHRVSFPPYSCQHLLLVFFLMVGILTGMRWCFLVVLVCISLMIRRRWACIHVPIKLLHFLFGEMSIHFFFPFFELGCLFSWCWVVWAVYICWILISFGHIIYRCFLPFGKLSLCLVDGFLCCAKTFQFN